MIITTPTIEEQEQLMRQAIETKLWQLVAMAGDAEQLADVFECLTMTELEYIMVSIQALVDSTEYKEFCEVLDNVLMND
jgi:hypothetical protein